MEGRQASGAEPGRGWSVVIALGSAQFIMVLDSTVMNVSIERVIQDLDTTVTRMQLAIATYTLTTAALMMLGGKIGDIIGRRRAFRIGLVTFGVGAGITAAAPSIGVLVLGWSILEAIGAALMIPAVAALITSNYSGRERAIAFGIIGGIAGAAAAAGPIIGGWVSTEFSWRVVFAAEGVIAVGLLLASRLIRDARREGEAPSLDGVGALLSASGLALARARDRPVDRWGWIEPKEALTIAGIEITPFGFSVVPFLIVGGIATLLAASSAWERRMVAARPRPPGRPLDAADPAVARRPLDLGGDDDDDERDVLRPPALPADRPRQGPARDRPPDAAALARRLHRLARRLADVVAVRAAGDGPHRAAHRRSSAILLLLVTIEPTLNAAEFLRRRWRSSAPGSG